MPGRPGRQNSCACRPVVWRGKRGPRRSVRTWAFLHDSDKTAQRLGVESGGNGDPTSIGSDEFAVRLRGRARKDGIGKDSDWEELIVGTGGRTGVAGGGFGRERLVEVIPKGGERDAALATEDGLRQAAAA